MRSVWLSLCLVLLALPACSLERRPVLPLGDVGTDAPRDGGMDAIDSPLDTPELDVPLLDTPDTGVDAPIDGGTDAPVDGGTDAPDPCAACTASEVCCGGVCLDRNDPLHCGSCEACESPAHAAPTCMSATCGFACDSGFDDCNASAGDGCETTLGTLTNCTRCGEVCGDFPFTNESCALTGCEYACEAGHESCDASAPDCETDTDTSALHCGGCGNACPAGQTCSGGTCHGWRPLATTGAPSARYDHVAVWTGTQMIVWGGQNGTAELGDGARWNAATNTWSAMSATGAPSARRSPVFAWTGSQLIVWSGYVRTSGWLGDGAIYDPATNSWTAIGTGGAPGGRSRSNGVWTGSEMLFWGGWDGSIDERASDGSAFTPTASWDGLPGTALAVRRFHGTVWTGTAMVIWGGDGVTGFLGSGARYTRSTDAWSGLTNTGAPGARQQHAMVWVPGASRVVVWGGLANVSIGVNQGVATGGRYDPVMNSWSSVATSPLSARYDVGYAASSDELFVFGGRPDDDTFTPLGDGARYRPTTDAWTSFPVTGAPSARSVPSAVWTGRELVVFGGVDGAGALGSGAALTP